MRASRPSRPLNRVNGYMMENMDIDMVIDIPDTPDRVSRRGSLSREDNRRENAAAAVDRPREIHSIDKDYRNYLNGMGRMVPGIGKNPKHHSESQKYRDTQTDNRNGTHSSQNTSLFRRTTMGKDKGKSVCTNFRATSSASMQKNPVLNLNQRKGRAHVVEMAAPKRLQSEGIPTSSGFPEQGPQNSFKAVGMNNKGKEKIDFSSDPQDKKEDYAVSSTRSIISAFGHRRLVRNGCISPHAITTKAKQAVEQLTSPNGDISDQNGGEKTASGDLSSIDIREIVAEDDIRSRAKGKRVIGHSQTSKDDGAKFVDLPTSINGESMGSRSQNRLKAMGSSHPSVRHNIDRHHETGRRGENDSRGNLKSVSRVEEHEICALDREANKRLRRNGSTSAVFDEHGVSIVGTSREASRSRPARIKNHQRRDMQNPVLEVDESSPEVRVSCCQGTRRVENDESNVRARQIEADERLARELQEQLYQEAQVFGDEEINENIAWMLQEQENTVRAFPTRDPRRSNPASSVAHGRSRLRTRFQQSSSSRGRNIPQPRASGRATRARGHRLGSSPAALSRALNFRFPSEMALESRLDILEELETVIGQFGSSMNSGLLQHDRDFNEDDYELLLGLDEDNHRDRRAGTSASQINSLPQSTVQNDNFEETCVICLDTPKTGDVIRHLPCLHKFHKDCIDPWLERSKSCPVCKSSVT
ncbi:PREDICTED: uncharacterized protein LOC104816022 [Tarenaya hassleriana]|uniref:uncharacterized protein LOC104816022 n=1 Tax=Tarenaya hassleriana TaxID=28532 RepID=UPI00053C2DB9|nr:PREDICTED: uncharacterized protein LOC104816022 [Tarenaya hassleriana]